MTTPAATRYFIGLMSGTSLDGVDGVLCQINDHGDVQVVQHVHEAFHPRLPIWFGAGCVQARRRDYFYC